MDDRFDQKLRERLKRLDSAIPPERPAIRLRVGRQLPRARRTSAPILGLAVVALVIAVILSAGLAAQRFVATESSASPGSPTPGATPAATTSQTIVIGPGGFPVSIDGEKVYRFEDQWPDTSASFLVAAGAPYGPPTCPIPFPRPTPGPAADSDFVAECPPVILFDTAGFLSGQSSGRAVAPKGLSLSAFTPWGGHLIVVRAHTHDAEAAQCSPSLGPVARLRWSWRQSSGPRRPRRRRGKCRRSCLSRPPSPRHPPGRPGPSDRDHDQGCSAGEHDHAEHGQSGPDQP